MRAIVWVGLLAGALLSLPLSAPAADTMKPGLWEITTTMEMPGMPFQPPAQSVRHCYTAEEVRERPVPQDDQCRITGLKTVGSTTSWKFECRGEMAGKGEGEITYRGDTAYEGKSRMQVEGMTMTTSYQGRRIGDCK